MLRSRATPSVRSRKNPPSRFRPTLELLEDRLTPATLHWTGAAGTNWSTASNWLENRAPINGDVLAFDTAATAVQSFTSTNDLPALGLAGLFINDNDATPGHDFSILGNALALSGSLTHSMTGAATSIGLSALTLLNPAAWTNNAGTLNVASNLNMNGLGLTVTGAGNTTLSGVISSLGSVSGLRGDYYSVPTGATPALLDPTSASWLGYLAPTVTAITPQVYFTNIIPNSFAPYANVGISNIAARWTGWINIPTSGTIDFATYSDDGSRLYIDGNLVVDSDFFQGATFREGGINLSAGLHAIDIEYFQAGGSAIMSTGWDLTGSGIPSNVVGIPTSAFSLFNGLIMNGTGMLTLTNANTYTGPTVVNAGTLRVTGALDPASAVTIGSAGTLSGTGIIGGAVTVNSGGSIRLGAAAAVLSSGDLTLGAGSTFGVNLTGAATDQLNVTGSVGLNSATLSALVGATPTSGETYVLINNDGSDAIVGTFAGLAEGATVTLGGHRFVISYHGGDGNDVVLTADHAPVAGASTLSYLLNEDQSLSVAVPGLLAGASDADGDPLSVVLSTGTAHGTLTLNPDGSFTYTPNTNFAGSDSFTYTVSDGDLASALVTVNITILAVNHAPIATNDSYGTNENTPLGVAAPGVLSNDSDPDGDPLSALLVSGPSHGSLALNADGSFTYTPNANYAGSDSFTYAASDGNLTSSPVTVNITVLAVNHAPSATGDSYSTNENTPLVVTAPGVLSNDNDPDGDHLSAVLVNGPSHGTLVLNADGSFTYTPSTGYSGTDSFTYQASDGSLISGAVTVNLLINAANHAPTAVADSYSTGRNRSLVVATPGVLANDTDPDGDHLSAFLVSGPSYGKLIFNSNGSFTYTPKPGYSGTDSFTYQVSDGSLLSAPVCVTLTITSTPLNITGDAGLLVLGYQRTALSNVPVATFRLGDGTVAPSSITALISWGDGTKSLGTVSWNGTSYTVRGSHTYGKAGVYALRVNVCYENVSAILRTEGLILDESAQHGWYHRYYSFFTRLYHDLLARFGLTHGAS